jgi:hypothetical protein
MRTNDERKGDEAEPYQQCLRTGKKRKKGVDSAVDKTLARSHVQNTHTHTKE